MHQNYLIDTNIIFDVYLPNRMGKEKSIECLSKLEVSRKYSSWIASHSVATIFYLLSKPLGKSLVKSELHELLQWVNVVPLNSDYTLKAFEYNMTDFEDAMQGACAELIGAKGIITRNSKDFKNSPVVAVTPEEFLTL